MALRTARRVGVPTGPAVLSLLAPLRDALAGTGPALLPAAADPAGDRVARAARLDAPVADDVALLLPTSGSTGSPKVVELPSGALLASARASHARLGGPGQWLLALPVAHVAGWQVLVRSVVADTDPVVVDLGRSFTPSRFAAAAARLTGTPRYASLVPTQLHRLLDDEAGLEALRTVDAVLLGGAAAPGRLLGRARAAGVAVVSSYGMTETCGGCVYDGRPLDGVDVAVGAGGRVLLSGPVLAAGYRGRPDLTAAAFAERGGRRWFTTTDLGRLDAGRLVVHGRADDVLVSGGRKVAPGAVEDVLSRLPGVDGCVVVGVPDAQWGQLVVALVAGDPGPEDVVRRHVAARLGAASAPRRVLRVAALPERGIGKPDRVAAADLAAALLAAHG